MSRYLANGIETFVSWEGGLLADRGRVTGYQTFGLEASGRATAYWEANRLRGEDSSKFRVGDKYGSNRDDSYDGQPYPTVWVGICLLAIK